MKQIMSYFLCVVLILLMTGCSTNKSDNTTDRPVKTTADVLLETNKKDIIKQKTENGFGGDNMLPIPSELITDFFSMNFPEEWQECCCYKITNNSFGTLGFTIDFYMNNKYSESCTERLFSICLTDDYDTFYEQYENYLGCFLNENNTYIYALVYYPDDQRNDSKNQELIDNLSSQIPTILKTIVSISDNYVFIFADEDFANENDNTLPFLPLFASNFGEELPSNFILSDITYTCLSSDGTYEYHGVGSSYGAYWMDDLHYYSNIADKNYNCYGVRDGKIVAYLNDLSKYNMTVQEYLGDDDYYYSFAPKTVDYGNMVFHTWQIFNGYLVITAYRSETSYLDDRVIYASTFSDREMCYFLNQNIDELMQERLEQQERANAEEEKQKIREENERLDLLQKMCRIGSYATNLDGYQVCITDINKDTVSLRIYKENDTDLSKQYKISHWEYCYDSYFSIDADDGDTEIYLQIHDNGFIMSLRPFEWDYVTVPVYNLDNQYYFEDLKLPGTACTEKTISTKLYSVTIPDSWINNCTYEIDEDEWSISFKIPNKSSLETGYLMFDIHLVWGNPSISQFSDGYTEYLGAIVTQDIGHLFAVYSLELLGSEHTQYINQVIESITPNPPAVFRNNIDLIHLSDLATDGLNDECPNLFSYYICNNTLVGATTNTFIITEENPDGDFFNMKVDDIGYFKVDKCDINYDYLSLTYKLYCDEYYAEVIYRLNSEYLQINITKGDEPVLNDLFFFYKG